MTLAELDVPGLRHDRRTRLLDAMAEHGIDVLILGRPSAVFYATGARALWTSGSRPFGPACVVVGETGRTHLLSVDDDGVPADMSHDDLFGLTWNPAKLVASLAAIPGLAGAKRVGTDSLSPGFDQLVAAIAPSAEVVDGTPAVWAARATKTPAELELVRQAVAIAESALTAMVDAVRRPGLSQRELVAIYLAHIASLGAPTPPHQHPISERRLGEGDLVPLESGAFFGGYEGAVARTWIVGGGPATTSQHDLAARCRTGLDALVGACRSGATGADVRAAWAATGEPFPAAPLVHGLGIGAEPPVITDAIGANAVLPAGAVLSVTASVGGFLERETVLVTDGAPEVLSRSARGPAATTEGVAR